MTLLHKQKMFSHVSVTRNEVGETCLTEFCCWYRCRLLLRKIEAEMEVKRKAVVAVLLLEGLNDEEKKAKRSCKVRR